MPLAQMLIRKDINACTFPLDRYVRRVGPVILGLDGVHDPIGDPTAILVFKPTNKKQWWRRLRIETTGDITVRSRKLSWWVFTLDLHGMANPRHGTSDLSFRVATKWDLSRGEIKNKRNMALGEATEGRLHWNLNYNLPELEGSFVSQQRAALSRDVHADVGFAHASISKVELVAWPWCNNPKWEGIQRWHGDEAQTPRDDRTAVSSPSPPLSSAKIDPSASSGIDRASGNPMEPSCTSSSAVSRDENDMSHRHPIGGMLHQSSERLQTYVKRLRESIFPHDERSNVLR